MVAQTDVTKHVTVMPSSPRTSQYGSNGPKLVPSGPECRHIWADRTLEILLETRDQERAPVRGAGTHGLRRTCRTLMSYGLSASRMT